MGLAIESPSLDYPITLSYCKIRDFSVQTFMQVIQNTLNSNQDFAIDDRLKVELTHVEVPQGRGK